MTDLQQQSAIARLALAFHHIAPVFGPVDRVAQGIERAQLEAAVWAAHEAEDEVVVEVRRDGQVVVRLGRQGDEWQVVDVTDASTDELHEAVAEALTRGGHLATHVVERLLRAEPGSPQALDAPAVGAAALVPDGGKLVEVSGADRWGRYVAMVRTKVREREIDHAMLAGPHGATTLASGEGARAAYAEAVRFLRGEESSAGR